MALFHQFVALTVYTSLLCFTCMLAEWKLICYDDFLFISCDPAERIVIHGAQFGYFEKTHEYAGKNDTCASSQFGDCWVDVTSFVAKTCSGHLNCGLKVHYSVGLPHDSVARQCVRDPESTSKPSIFVEYGCVLITLFTKLSRESRVDTEQVGGYLSSLDYTEALNGGSEWRGHLAEALCLPGEERLPTEFNLPAPVPQVHQLFGQENTAVFVLRIKDISLTQSAALNGDLTDQQFLSDMETTCSGPGASCRMDYLDIAAELPPNVHSNVKLTTSLLPVARFCLGNVKNQSDLESFPVNRFNSRSSSLIGKVYGPLPPAVRIRFTTNFNLLDPHVVPGKGILLEYIALFCTPINPPSGQGIVDYRFQALPHSPHTVAYAELFCPSDRWLEPQRPGVINGGDAENGWWLQRHRHATRICDHHKRIWLPDYIPEACLTKSELDAFVAKVRTDMERENSTATEIPSYHSISYSAVWDSSNKTYTGYAYEGMVSRNDSTRNFLPFINNSGVAEAYFGKNRHAGSSVAVGAVLGFLICLMGVLLVAYSLRHRILAQYTKTISYPSVPDRMVRTNSTFTQSVPNFYPSPVDLRRRMFTKSKWDMIRPWRATHWSQNLNGTFPDLPRQTFLQSSAVLNGNKTPETLIVGRTRLPPWRLHLQNNGVSAFSLVPSCPNGERSESAFSSGPLPWLRTHSSNHLGISPTLFASSGELHDSGETNLTLHSWWLPWRHSMRRQRRLYTQLQRRREVQSQSRRHLVDSGALSNSSSTQFAMTPSSQTSSKKLSQCVAADKENHTPVSRGLNDGTTRKNKTFTMDAESIDGLTAAYPGGASESYQSNTPTFQLQLPYTNANVVNGSTHPTFESSPQPYGEAQLEDENDNGVDDPLPWRSTPPQKGLTSGFKRISSLLLRSLNGSLTPPRSSRNTEHLAGQLFSQSASNTNSQHYFQINSSETYPSVGRASLGSQTRSMAHTVQTNSESDSAQCIGQMRNTVSIPTSQKDPSYNVYNLDGDDSVIICDGSIVTKANCVNSITAALPKERPEDWVNRPPIYEKKTTGFPSVCSRPPTGRSPPVQVVEYSPQGSPPTVDYSLISENPEGPKVPALPLPHSNDPYLEPLPVTRLKRELTDRSTGSQENQVNENVPSRTSSAVSSLIFADSVEEHTTESVCPPYQNALSRNSGTTAITNRSIPTSQITSNRFKSNKTTHHPAPVLDYVTYDETRSSTNALCAVFTGSQTQVKGTEGELMPTQLPAPFDFENPTTLILLGNAEKIKRHAHSGEVPSTPRPLSDAMISNHYYDSNAGPHCPYSEIPSGPPKLPPRINPPISTEFRSHPPLPPLWSHAPPTSNHQRPTSGVSDLSMDSLYETVDHFAKTSASVLANPSEQEVSHLSDSAATVTRYSQDTAVRPRQGIALPPTPGSVESVRAPDPSPDGTHDTDA
ncbi:unnamed protein product [Calicophoron daubneyi]|uniref:CUB domain-containing protein n=1 Tax=Calicophoron daubneyi TaxID=300641 RepID=A0AAV2TXC6_CALDB